MPCDEGLSPHEIHNWVKSDKKLYLTCCNFYSRLDMWKSRYRTLFTYKPGPMSKFLRAYCIVMLVIKRSTFCQKGTVHKDRKALS